MSVISTDQGNLLKEHFDEHGYVSIPDFLNTREISEVHTSLGNFIQDRLPSLPEGNVFYEDKADPSTLKQIQLLFEHDDYFRNMMFGSQFEKLAGILLGEGVKGKNMQYFNKPPAIGLPTPPHQDGYFFKLKPNHALTMWIALEDVDEENGCVRYVDRSHKWGMRAHSKSGVLGFSQSIADFGIENDRENEIAFPCKAGHLIAHHSLTIHRADGNQSRERTRRALGFIYYGTSAKEDEAAHKAYQDQLKQELAELGKV
jgi:phytanoyl-CoA hydroxylase